MFDKPVLPTLLADASIIQEQPDHLVVAIRIPKALINANLHLFAALADCAGGGSNQGAGADWDNRRGR